MTETIADPRYERAMAVWLSRRFRDSKGKPLDPDKISHIEFDTFGGGYCETCAYDAAGITFRYAGNFRTEELDYTDRAPAKLVAEVVAIMQEAEDDG